MTSLKVRTKDGFVTTIQVEELLEVNGREYHAVAGDPLMSEIMELKGRVSAIENVFIRYEESVAG